MASAYGVGARLGTLVLLALIAAAPAPSRKPVMRLLVIGDSLAAGYGLPHAEGFEAQLTRALANRGVKIRIVDAAVSGATSADGLARLGWVLGGIPPDKPLAALVELGANDGLRALPVRQLRENLSAILDRLAARHIPVLLAGMYAPPNLGPGYERRFRAVYAALGRRPGVVLEPFFLAGVARVPALTQPDGLHPNATGVKRVVALILPYIHRVLAMAVGR